MKYRVIFQPRALSSLEEQYRHIANDNPEAAAKWLNRFVDAIEGLSDKPERCPVARESEHVGIEIRQFLFGKRQGVRRVLFVVDGNTVRILSVRHSAQADVAPDDLLG